MEEIENTLGRWTPLGYCGLFSHKLFIERMYICLVIVSTKSNGDTQTEHYNVRPSGNMTSSKTLVLAVDQRKPGATMTLYVNCEHFGTLHTAKTLREVYFDMKDPHLQMVSLYQTCVNIKS